MNTDFFIVGGDGDLALRKLYPALYYLELNDSMPENFRIIGSARTGQSQEEFQVKVKTWLQKHVASDLFSEEKWQTFSSRLHFAQGDATNVESLRCVRDKFFKEESVIVVYLAIPPKIFGTVCSSLKESGMVTPSMRLIVEKPLGDNRESFLEINEELSRVFSEEQLFRIDHYLGKESVQNLMAMRFANDFFEPLWNNKYIDHVQITVTETVGVGNRWAFYDQTGATRDMVQNHLLQVLCLMAMEPPASLCAESVRAEKLKVLNCLKPITDEDVSVKTVRGQYVRGELNGKSVPGYREEESDKYAIDPNSQTETFVAIQAEIQNWRWSGVPIFLRTGKRLNRKHSEIVVHFKQNNHKVFEAGMGTRCPNKLIIQLQPDAGIRLHLNSKVPGLESGMPIQDGYLYLDFDDHSKTMRYDAYSRLLFDVFRNEQTLFVGAAEVEAAWGWIDQIFASWKSTGQACEDYVSGGEGPERSQEMVKNRGLEWFDEDLVS
jgi:glucose-6-phosphate 1-dehydrogenase